MNDTRDDRSGPTAHVDPPGPGRSAGGELTRDEREVGGPLTRDERLEHDATRVEIGVAPETEHRGRWTRFNLPPGLASRYSVLRDLGEGGQGSVLLARNRETGDEVAIKTYPPGVGLGATLERLERMSSQHVAAIVETGEDEHAAWEVMEHITGGTLADLAREHGGTLPPEVMTRVVEELASALLAFESAQIVHRDVKPSNIMVRSREPLDLVFVDFGGMRVLERTLVFTKVVMTARWAAPEAVYGGASTGSAWWGLGIMVSELLGGRHPWADEEGLLPESPDRQAFLIGQTPPNLDHLDARWALLCRGLLTPAIEQRWGHAEVSRWLAGETPEVAAYAPRVPVAGPGAHLVLAGHEFAEPADVAVALASEPVFWNEFVGILENVDRPEFRRLRAWMADAGAGDVVRILDEDGLSGAGRPAPTRAVALIRLLAPDLPASFGGGPANRQWLRDMAVRATSELEALPGGQRPTRQTAPANTLLDDLEGTGALQELAGLAGGDGLSHVEDAWPRGIARYRSHAEPLAPELSAERALALARARILAALVDAQAAAQLRARADEARADREARRREWFTRLATTTRDGDAAGYALDAVVMASRGLAVAEERQARAALETARGNQLVAARERAIAAAPRWVLPLFILGLTPMAVAWCAAYLDLGVGGTGQRWLIGAALIGGMGLMIAWGVSRMRRPWGGRLFILTVVLVIVLLSWMDGSVFTGIGAAR